MDPEETLDPADWSPLRRLGHRMVDDMLGWLETVRDRPVWQPMAPERRAELDAPLPRAPQELEGIYEEFRRNVLPYPTGNIHPRFWGWVIGTGTPVAMLAEMLAAGMNPNVGGFEDAPTRIEGRVIAWCSEMLGFAPAGSPVSGLLVSGASLANLLGLAVARNTKAGFDIRRQGLAAAPKRLMLYGSAEMHNSVQKAVELLGLGSESLRKIPVDADYRVDPRALEAAIRADRAAGHQPFCVIGCAGTVNTGAMDDLEALADLCGREGLWLHVDGAFGAMAALAPDLRPRLKGIERADSLAFDLHKWGYMPYEAGCLLVRHAAEHRQAFALEATYLMKTAGGLAAGGPKLSDYGIELSRGFKALKIWMSLKAYGTEKLGRVIRQNVEQARYLAVHVRETPELELMAPAPLNIVCFRYVGKPGSAHSPDQLDTLNQHLLVRLQEEGTAAPSFTRLGGRFTIRVAISNHRSRFEDFDMLVREVVRLGRILENEL